jgi:hypothetical protein
MLSVAARSQGIWWQSGWQGRLGEMMAEQPKAQGVSGRFMGGVPDTPPIEPPTLASQGIDKNLAISELGRWDQWSGLAVPLSEVRYTV